MSSLQVHQPQQGALVVEQPFVPMAAGLSPENKLALMEYWRSIMRRKWAILALAVVIALVTAAVAFSLTPVYRSTVTVLIEAGKGKVVSIEDVYSSAGQNRENYQTQVEIIKSREVAVRTAAALKLWNYPEFDPRKAQQGVGAKLRAAVGIKPELVQWTDEALADAAGARLMTVMSVEPVRLSQLVKISIDSSDKVLAARVANAVADNYIDADRDARFKLTQQVNTWLQNRLGALREKVARADQALQIYRERQGLVSLGGSAQTMAGQTVQELNNNLGEARARRAQLEGAYRQVVGAGNGDYNSVPAVVSNAAVTEARRREAEVNQRVEEMAATLGPQHVRMLQAQAELKAVRENLRAQVQSVVTSVRRDYEAAVQAERSLEASMVTARGSVQAVNRQEFELAALEREVQSNRQIYDLFLTRAKETNVAADIQATVGRVVDSAAIASGPVSPKKAQMVTVALVLGLLLGALGAVLLEKLDNTIKGSEDAETRLHQPVLTTLPTLTDEDGEKSARTRIFLDKPNSHHAEAIRTARTGVLLSNIDATSRVLLVTSSVPGEGKTTLCTNLALAHAQTKRTLLIDADMRNPQVGMRLGLPANAKGLSDLVAGTATLTECLHQVEGSPLLILPAGMIPPNPLELLLSKRFQETLASLASQVEVILIDSPPVELVSDALVLSPMAQSTIYVVKAMETPYPLARKGLTRLQRAGGRILGVVVNQMDFDKAQRYYGSLTGAGSYGNAYYGAGAKAAAESKNAA